MEEGNKRQNFDSGVRNEARGEATAKISKFKPTSVAFFFLIALLVVAVAFFQIQITSLRRELYDLKAELSKEDKPMNLKKRSLNEIRQQTGIDAAHLQGVLAYQHIEREGKIGPWTVLATNDAFITLRKKSTEIEITQTGLYYVYAQVYYLTSESHNSFQILSYNGTEERKHYQNLVTCSSQGRNSIGEASCYTGFTFSFHSGQRLYLNQVEQNRIIHFTNGCSYFGVVLLRKNAILKPKTR